MFFLLYTFLTFKCYFTSWHICSGDWTVYLWCMNVAADGVTNSVATVKQWGVRAVLDNAAISGYCSSYLVTLKVCCRLHSTVRLCMNVPFYFGKELFVMMHSQTLLSFRKIKGKFLLRCAWIYSVLMSLLSQELLHYAAHIKLLLKQLIEEVYQLVSNHFISGPPSLLKFVILFLYVVASCLFATLTFLSNMTYHCGCIELLSCCSLCIFGCFLSFCSHFVCTVYLFVVPLSFFIVNLCLW